MHIQYSWNGRFETGHNLYILKHMPYFWACMNVKTYMWLYVLIFIHTHCFFIGLWWYHCLSESPTNSWAQLVTHSIIMSHLVWLPTITDYHDNKDVLLNCSSPLPTTHFYFPRLTNLFGKDLSQQGFGGLEGVILKRQP